MQIPSLLTVAIAVALLARMRVGGTTPTAHAQSMAILGAETSRTRPSKTKDKRSNEEGLGARLVYRTLQPGLYFEPSSRLELLLLQREAHLHWVDGGLSYHASCGARQQTLSHVKWLPVIPIQQPLHLQVKGHHIHSLKINKLKYIIIHHMYTGATGLTTLYHTQQDHQQVSAIRDILYL